MISRFKSTLGLMLICCLCIYIPTLNKIYLLTYYDLVCNSIGGIATRPFTILYTTTALHLLLLSANGYHCGVFSIVEHYATSLSIVVDYNPGWSSLYTFSFLDVDVGKRVQNCACVLEQWSR